MDDVKRVILSAVVALSMILGATGLAGAAQAAGDKIKVRLAAQATSGQVFQYLAKEKGYLDDEGIEEPDPEF